MKSTELLLQDHRHMLEGLEILVEMAACAERNQIVNDADVQHILEFLKGFGDRHHQGREESVLFPALLKDHAQKHYGELCGLVFEHNRERSLVEGLQESMITKSRKDFVYYARHLSDLLRAHIRKEEEILFPLIDSTLTPAEDDLVVSAMQAYDRVWQKANLSGLMRNLEDMESKYLRKTS